MDKIREVCDPKWWGRPQELCCLHLLLRISLRCAQHTEWIDSSRNTHARHHANNDFRIQRMAALRAEADEAQAKVEELNNKVKTLEQENLDKEQEIKSLTHRNQLLESEAEKLDNVATEAKAAASESAQHNTQNEALQRRLQLLEEEAEEADKTLRETNEKYVEYTRALTAFSCGKANYGLQASPNRRQGWSLRTQGTGARSLSRPVGIQVRGDGKEARGDGEGVPRVGSLYQQHLRKRCRLCCGSGFWRLFEN